MESVLVKYRNLLIFVCLLGVYPSWSQDLKGYFCNRKMNYTICFGADSTFEFISELDFHGEVSFSKRKGEYYLENDTLKFVVKEYIHSLEKKELLVDNDAMNFEGIQITKRKLIIILSEKRIFKKCNEKCP